MASHEQQFQQVLDTLNPNQQKAVEHIDGPALVIAGPGTGKTQILSARTGYLLRHQDLQIDPHNILCLTFTDAASIAMRQRLLQFIGPTAHHVPIYTFHAFCNYIIQNNLDYFGQKEYELISELENIELLEEMINELDLHHPLKRFKGNPYFEANRLNHLFQTMKDEDWSPEYVVKSIDRYLNDLPNREDYIYKRSTKKGNKPGDIKTHLIQKEERKMEKLRAGAELFDDYCERMKERNRYDYSDMISWVLNAFREDEDFLRNYQEQFQYFLVDEYQDTNGAQNELLYRLTDFWESPNVFVVGDDDQSIYRFQGANVQNIKEFHERYQPDLSEYVLNINYRSSQHILDFSQKVIQQNQSRLTNQFDHFEKDLKAQSPDYADSDIEPEVVSYPHVTQEETALVNRLEELYQNGEDLSEVGVLYSHHRVADNIIQALERKGIPYNTSRKVNLLDEPLIEQLLTLLRYLQHEYQRPYTADGWLFELLHYDFLGFHTADITKVGVAFKKNQTNCDSWRELIGDKESLEQLELDHPIALFNLSQQINKWIQAIANLPVQQYVEKIINESGLLRHIVESDEKVWLMEVLTSFFNFVKEENGKQPHLSLQEFLNKIDRMQQHRLPIEVTQSTHNEQGINLMTVHASKGLEFRYVFLIGCLKKNWESTRKGGGFSQFSFPDTLIPSFQGDRQDEVEERRRLFFVAITRAKEYLQLSYALTNRNDKPTERTQFIDEVLDEQEEKATENQVDEEAVTNYRFHLLREKETPELPQVEEEYLNALLENYSLSVTHLNKYLQCPISFYFENVLRVPVAKKEPMAFGSAAHYALNRLFLDMKNDKDQQFPPKETFLQYFEDSMKRQRDSFTEESFRRRMQQGQKILPQYYDHYVSKWNKVAVVEYFINNVEVEGVPINGKIDKIEFNGFEANVVDYKTGRADKGQKKLKPPKDDEDPGGDYWRQIVFYKLLMDNDTRKNWKMTSGEIDFIEKHRYNNKFVKKQLTVDPDDISIVTQQVKETYERIMNHEFFKGCGEERCRWCNFVQEHLSDKEQPLQFEVPEPSSPSSQTDNSSTPNDQGKNLTLDLD